MKAQGAQMSTITSYDHVNFRSVATGTHIPTVGRPVGEQVYYEITYGTGGAISGFVDSIDITPTSAADLEQQLEDWLNSVMGGIWTVEVTVSGGDLEVTDVTSIAAVDRKLSSFYVDAGTNGTSDHFHAKFAYEDPHLAVARALMDAGNLATSENGTCKWRGTQSLPTSGAGTGTMAYEYEILANSITCNISIRDPSFALLAIASFIYEDPPFNEDGYECDRRYLLRQLSADSIQTPNAGVGPTPGDRFDWSGVAVINMNQDALDGN
jgi:hypothetical protein